MEDQPHILEQVVNPNIVQKMVVEEQSYSFEEQVVNPNIVQ